MIQATIDIYYQHHVVTVEYELDDEEELERFNEHYVSFCRKYTSKSEEFISFQFMDDGAFVGRTADIIGINLIIERS